MVNDAQRSKSLQSDSQKTSERSDSATVLVVGVKETRLKRTAIEVGSGHDKGPSQGAVERGPGSSSALRGQVVMAQPTARSRVARVCSR